MWQLVQWFGQSQMAWVPPTDLWRILATTPQPTPRHILAQIDVDAPHRWFLPAD